MRRCRTICKPTSSEIPTYGPDASLPPRRLCQVKDRGSASELLQKAVRAELRRLDLLAETDRYVADLVAEVGPPS